MIQLPNNCNCSGIAGDPKKGTKDELSISPKNWKTTAVSLKKDWYIHYYFRDPQFKEKYPKGKWVRVKGGINYFKTREERQEAVRILLAEILRQLKEEGYNPITNTFSPPFVEPETAYEIDPETPFLEALVKAKARLKISDHHHENIKSTLKYFSIAVRALTIKWVTKPIKDVIFSLWTEALLEAIENGAAKTDYLFSKGLLSGPNPIRSEQITRRWKRWVKR